MSNAPTRADAAKLASVSISQARRFRRAFAETGFLPQSEDDIPEVLELRSRGGRNLPRLLHLTAAERPLDVFARLFLTAQGHSAKQQSASQPVRRFLSIPLLRDV
jgi:hypothetical protein